MCQALCWLQGGDDGGAWSLLCSKWYYTFSPAVMMQVKWEWRTRTGSEVGPGHRQLDPEGLSHLQFTWRTDIQAIIDGSPGWGGAAGRVATWSHEPRVSNTVFFLLLIIELESLLLVSSLWNWPSTALLSNALTNFAFLQSTVFISHGSLRCWKTTGFEVKHFAQILLPYITSCQVWDMLFKMRKIFFFLGAIWR